MRASVSIESVAIEGVAIDTRIWLPEFDSLSSKNRSFPKCRSQADFNPICCQRRGLRNFPEYRWRLLSGKLERLASEVGCQPKMTVLQEAG
jgi:hypothetical protein